VARSDLDPSRGDEAQRGVVCLREAHEPREVGRLRFVEGFEPIEPARNSGGHREITRELRRQRRVVDARHWLPPEGTGTLRDCLALRFSDDQFFVLRLAAQEETDTEANRSGDEDGE
jgi:hypothetical protein